MSKITILIFLLHSIALSQVIFLNSTNSSIPVENPDVSESAGSATDRPQRSIPSFAPTLPPPPKQPPKPYNPPPRPDLSPFQLVRLRDVLIEGQTFGQAMKRLSPKLNGQGISAVRKSNRLLVSQQVQNKLDQFQSSPYISTHNFQTNKATASAAGKLCTFQGMSYSSPTHEFLHIDQNYDSIFPGSVLMSKYLKGGLDSSSQQVLVPDSDPGSPKIKNEKISIYDQLNVNTFRQNNNMASISKTISSAIRFGAPQNKDYSIYFQMGTTDQLADFANRLNFNKALLKKLGVNFQGGSITNYIKKFFFLFTKPIGTFQAVIKSATDGLPDTPLNTFYSQRLTLRQFNSRIPFWWSAPNPPVYIDSITYGSIIILTVNYNSVTSSLYDLLKKASSPVSAQPILNALISQPSLQVFSRGPFNTIEINAIRNGNWLDGFIRVPNSDTNTIIQPLVYSVKDFNQAQFKTANQFNYVKVCSADSPPPKPKPFKILVQLDYILNKAPVIVTIKTLSKQTILTKYFYTSTKFDISDYLTEMEMKVTIRATASNPQPEDYSPQRQQGVFGFVVNNSYSYKAQINCFGRCAQQDVGVYTVRKQTGQIIP